MHYNRNPLIEPCMQKWGPHVFFCLLELCHWKKKKAMHIAQDQKMQ